MLEARLRNATPAPIPVDDGIAVSGDALPLYPGVVQRGRVAIGVASGAPLAVAPGHWTDGCPVLEERRTTVAATIVERAYLDPRTGRFLYVEAVPEGIGRSFAVSPERFA
jgi:N-methylhydantoinase B